MPAERTDTLAIVAHPDDETLYAGGLLALASKSGRHCGVISLTSGSAGRTLGLVEPAGLAAERTREWESALDELGVGFRRNLSYPDYGPVPNRDGEINPGLQGENFGNVVARLGALLQCLRPKVLVTFPPNGINGHPDHVTTHKLVLAALGTTKVPASEIYYFGVETLFYRGPQRPGYLSETELAQLAFKPSHLVDIRPVLGSKLRALACFKTQALSVLGFMRHYPLHFQYEGFSKARGNTGPATPKVVNSL